ncbi:hypothetical protein D3C76_884860 [compost metagenome]
MGEVTHPCVGLSKRSQGNYVGFLFGLKSAVSWFRFCFYLRYPYFRNVLFFAAQCFRERFRYMNMLTPIGSSQFCRSGAPVAIAGALWTLCEHKGASIGPLA